MADGYLTAAKGIRILPGQWRPHHPFEHIAWVSPAWPCQDYLWLDFPEAIWSERELLFLSHFNPKCPASFGDEKKAPWRSVPGGIAYERVFPNGLKCAGQVTHVKGDHVDLRLDLENRGDITIKNIKLQTCLYLRPVRELSDFTSCNKLVHVPGGGWVPMDRAVEASRERGTYFLGWPTFLDQSGPAPADLPMVVCRSNQTSRLVSLTWFENTFSLQNNPNHPCMHADPAVGDLDPGESATINGKIVFFEGTIEEFDDARPWES